MSKRTRAKAKNPNPTHARRARIRRKYQRFWRHVEAITEYLCYPGRFTSFGTEAHTRWMKKYKRYVRSIYVRQERALHRHLNASAKALKRRAELYSRLSHNGGEDV